MLPIDLYIRVSRVGGRVNMISPDEQERRGRELARQHNLVVGEVLTDLDESGGKWERPGLQEGLRRVREGLSGGLIVAWLDRLSRDSEHAHRIVRELTEAGGRIYAPDAPADWTSPEGELQAGILFQFATYVRKRSAAGFERAKSNAIERGIPVNNRAAVGYRKGDDRRLEIDEAVAPTIRKVFEARIGGAGPEELAQLLEADGITTSQGSRTWSKAAVYGMLKNRVYLGELSYGKDRRFVNLVAHPAIVDRATWELAQPAVSLGRAITRSHLLAGLIRCDGCRHAMQGTISSHGHPIYRCVRRHAGGMCNKPASCRADRIEEAVVADLWATMPNLVAYGQNDDAEGRIADLHARATRERLALLQWSSPAIQAEIGDLDIYANGLRERRESTERAERALAAEQALHHAAEPFATMADLRADWDNGTITLDERNELLRIRYDVVRLGRNPDLLIVYPSGVGPSDLPTRGYRRNTLVRPFDSDVPPGTRTLQF